MCTRRSNYPNNSNVTIPRRQRRQVSNIVEPEIRTIVAPMAERTMEELLRAPTEGYGEAIVLPEINAIILRLRRICFSWMNATSSKTDERIDKLADQLSTLVEIVSKKVVTPAPVKAVEESCVIVVVERESEETRKKSNKVPRMYAQSQPPVIPISIPEPDVPKTLPKTTPIPEPDVPKSLPKPKYIDILHDVMIKSPVIKLSNQMEEDIPKSLSRFALSVISFAGWLHF
ncbi:hypothetical protein Tco_0162775 [Tanacetum coccineum]